MAMDAALLLKAAVMGVVEGLTEFLPISSTGHLILAGSLLGFDEAKASVFEVAIQIGAICAVVLVYWQKIRATLLALPTQRQAQRFAAHVLIGFAPAALLGLLAGKAIKAHLFNAPVVALALVAGGIVIFWAEGRQRPARIQSVDEMSGLDALKVGLAQCVAMIPGVSRSGATIIGGMLLGLSRPAATEFSFFLAIPTMLGATLLKIVKMGAKLTGYEWMLIALGFVLSFIFAYIVIKVFMNYIKKHNFKIFGYYRIILGIAVIFGKDFLKKIKNKSQEE